MVAHGVCRLKERQYAIKNGNCRTRGEILMRVMKTACSINH